MPSTLQLQLTTAIPTVPQTREEVQSPEGPGSAATCTSTPRPQCPQLSAHLLGCHSDCVCEEVAMNSCLCSCRGAPGGSAGASTRASLRLGLSVGLFVPEWRQAPLYLWCVIQCLAESQPESVHGREMLIQAGQGSEWAAALLGASGAGGPSTGGRVQQLGASGGWGPPPGEERVRSGFAFLFHRAKVPRMV